MAEIRVILTDTLKEDYRRLPQRIQRKFDKQLRFLAANPCPNTGAFYPILRCASTVLKITGSYT